MLEFPPLVLVLRYDNMEFRKIQHGYQKLSDVLSRTESLLSRATGELDPAALAFNSAKEVYASAAEYRGNF